MCPLLSSPPPPRRQNGPEKTTKKANKTESSFSGKLENAGQHKEIKNICGSRGLRNALPRPARARRGRWSGPSSTAAASGILIDSVFTFVPPKHFVIALRRLLSPRLGRSALLNAPDCRVLRWGCRFAFLCYLFLVSSSGLFVLILTKERQIYRFKKKKQRKRTRRVWVLATSRGGGRAPPDSGPTPGPRPPSAPSAVSCPIFLHTSEVCALAAFSLLTSFRHPDPSAPTLLSLRPSSQMRYFIIFACLHSSDYVNIVRRRLSSEPC